MKLTKWGKRRIFINKCHVTYATKNKGCLLIDTPNKWLYINGLVWNWGNKSYCWEFRRHW
jgi:hypothetical protein